VKGCGWKVNKGGERGGRREIKGVGRRADKKGRAVGWKEGDKVWCLGRQGDGRKGGGWELVGMKWDYRN